MKNHSPIGQVEDALLLLAKDCFAVGNKNALRECKSIGGGWTLTNLQKALQFAPGVYVTFQGAASTQTPGFMDARFAVYVVTKGTDDANRRRGNPRTLGAYAIASRLAAQLGGHTLDGIGTLKLTGIDNLFRDAMFDLGGTVYALNLTLPVLDMSYTADMSTLDDFITFDATFEEVDETDESPDMKTQVTLPPA